MTARARRWLAFALAIVAVERLLDRALVGGDFMGALAEVRHGRLGAAVAFGLLVAVRLVATIVVPSVCLAWSALVGWDALAAARDRLPPPP